MKYALVLPKHLLAEAKAWWGNSVDIYEEQKIPMKTPEGYEKDEIKRYLATLGCFFFSPHMAGMGKSGVPDILACIEGRFWGIEVKRPGKAATVLQARRGQEIEQAGGLWVCGTAEVVIQRINEWILAGRIR